MLEVIGVTVEDCIAIEKAGADRIELVSALSEGGLTPSIGLIEQCVGAVSIPVRVMIRPHSKSFCYSAYDLEVMKDDIQAVRTTGAKGIVVGLLNADGKIATKSLEKLFQVSNGLEITFHRAFDELTDLEEGLHILRQYPQIKTILTSGGKGKLEDNSDCLKRLIEKADNKMEILVGGGVTMGNVDALKKETNANAFHIGRLARDNFHHNGSIVLSQIQAFKNKL